MTALGFEGKEAVIGYHKLVPLHLLDEDASAAIAPTEGRSTHVIIEGDNLTAMKSIMPEYAGRVNCIYIDPPYNTGKQSWVYDDNVNSPRLKAWLDEVMKLRREGKDDSVKEDDLCRHDKWLCLMYPRLRLMKELLRDDGIIMVSIDDNEVTHLRMLMNEIFGEKNFVAQFIWNTEGHTDNQFLVKVNHEYVVAYAKDIASVTIGSVVDPNTREESNLWKNVAINSITKNGKGNPPSEILLPAGFPCTATNLNLPPTTVGRAFMEDIAAEGFISRGITKKHDVDYPIRLDPMVVAGGKLTSPCRVFSGWANANKLRAFIANRCEPLPEEEGGSLRFYLSDRGVVYYHRDKPAARNIVSVLRNLSTTEQQKTELEQIGVVFQYPKPKELIHYLLRIGLTQTDGIVLDAFAGSGTTGHAVMMMNGEDSGKRRCILIQQGPEGPGKPNICREIAYKRVAYFAVNGGAIHDGWRYMKVGGRFMESGLPPCDIPRDRLMPIVWRMATEDPYPASPMTDLIIGVTSDAVAVVLVYARSFGENRQNMLSRSALASIRASLAGSGRAVRRIVSFCSGPSGFDPDEHKDLDLRLMPSCFEGIVS